MIRYLSQMVRTRVFHIYCAQIHSGDSSRYINLVVVVVVVLPVMHSGHLMVGLCVQHWNFLPTSHHDSCVPMSPLPTPQTTQSYCQIFRLYCSCNIHARNHLKINFERVSFHHIITPIIPRQAVTMPKSHLHGENYAAATEMMDDDANWLMLWKYSFYCIILCVWCSVHVYKDNVFEVVTRQRVFYVQVWQPLCCRWLKLVILICSKIRLFLCY